MAKPDPQLEMLSHVDLFQGLTAKELKTVLGQAKAISFRPEEVVAEEGSRGGRLYLILRGEAKVDVGGRFRASLGPGDYFGEISLIDGGPRSATVAAVTDLQTLSIASFNFRSLMKEQPLLALKLLEQLCRRIRSSEQSQLH
jgi:CRP/FNR family transcriptional regulator, cyclic AMP receptor protein